MPRRTWFTVWALVIIWYSGAQWGWGYKLLSVLMLVFVFALTYLSVHKED